MFKSSLISLDSTLIAPQLSSLKPLGEVLQQADLISAAQIEVALRDQIEYQDMRIGEILALRGWIKQETADFFAQQWLILLEQKRKQPLGYYLKEAALLNERQISTILAEQKQEQTRMLFGELAVSKGWIKQHTIDFFLEYLLYSPMPESLDTDCYSQLTLEDRICF